MASVRKLTALLAVIIVSALTLSGAHQAVADTPTPSESPSPWWAGMGGR
jgi:hypothetical protein